MTRMTCLAVGLCIIAGTTRLRAQELEAIEKDLAKGISAMILEQTDKLDKLKVRITGDADHASGLHVPMKAGAMLIPQKDIKETAEFAAKFKQENGAELAVLALYHLVPVIDGKPVDTSKLASITITSKEGESHTVQILLLTVKQLTDDDYRLYAFGAGDKPVVDAKFSEQSAGGDLPVALSVKERDEASHQGTLVVTVFGKYQANIRAAYAE